MRGMEREGHGEGAARARVGKERVSPLRTMRGAGLKIVDKSAQDVARIASLEALEKNILRE